MAHPTAACAQPTRPAYAWSAHSRRRRGAQSRASAGGAKQVSAQGNTLQEVLDDLYGRYPALKEQISSENGLSRYINVYVNDQDVRYLHGLETSIGPGDTVILLPAMAGGR